MDHFAAQRAAEMLFAEHKNNTPFKPFTHQCGLVTIADAYDVQDELITLLSANTGILPAIKSG